jgi:septal ring factor EnvC (AmiA/AmiB activator)
MRSLERRRQEEVPLYQVATYLAALDQLFDEQANRLREQTHQAKQAELAVRLQQIRAAQAEARVAAAASSEAVAQESLRQAQDWRMQEWTRSGTPVPAIGEDHVLLGTPVIGWGTLFGSTQAPPENPEGSAAVRNP